MNDVDIREELVVWLDSRYEKVRVFDELMIGKSRADIVAVTDCLTGYEIKGDADSYVRLPTQTKMYDWYFQRNFLVIGKSHRKSAEEHVPPHWGILCFRKTESGFETELMRDSQPNPKFKLAKQMSLLWRNELAHIQKQNALPTYRGKRKSFVIGQITASVPQEQLFAQICDELFERDYTKYRNV